MFFSRSCIVPDTMLRSGKGSVQTRSGMWLYLPVPFPCELQWRPGPSCHEAERLMLAFPFLLKADEMQDVTHFNYTAWPDHGVPTANAAESILQFVHVVRQQATKSRGPMIVHCR